MFIIYIAPFLWPFLAPNIPVLIVVQFILTLIVHFWHGDKTYQESNFFLWLVGGVAPYLIALFAISHVYPTVITPAEETQVVVIETVPILSLSNETTVAGGFILGISSRADYLSTRKTDDGGYKNFLISGSDTTVYEDAEGPDKASLVMHQKQIRELRTDLPSWVLYLTHEEAVGPWIGVKRFNKIHVPKGTVKREFTM